MALIDDAIAAYETALIALENAAPTPSFEEIVAALIARDGVEKKRQIDQAPAGATYAKLIALDDRLKAQSEAILRDDKLEEWKASVNPTPAQWWWHLNDLEPLLNKAIARYETALEALKTSAEADKSEQVLAVLLARDGVEESRKGQKQPPRASIAKLVKLDRELKEISPEIASYDTIAEWKVSLNRQAQSWWWEFKTTAPLPDRALDRYQRALGAIKENTNPSEEELLEALLARDEVEEAISGTFQNQPVPEKLARQLIDLDRQLKRHRLSLNANNQLSQWKRSLKRENFWWWNLKPELLGSEEDPPSPRDWVLTGLAIGALGIAASFILSTAQTFSKKVEGVQTDTAQNLATVLQVVGLGTAGAGALTKKGQETVEKMVTVLRLPAELHAPAALGIAGGLMVVTGIVNASLPGWGNDYIKQGQKFAKRGELIKARDSYLQASKFVRSAKAQAALTVGLGEIYERLGRYDKAIEEYEKARLLNNPTAMNALSRLLLLQELIRQGQLNIPKRAVVEAESLLGRSQEALDGEIENLITNDPEGALIFTEATINQGLVEWFKARWPRQTGIRITSPPPAATPTAPDSFNSAAIAVPPFQGPTNVERFRQENLEFFRQARGRFGNAITFLQFLRDQHGDRQNIAGKLAELEQRANCLLDASNMVLVSLAIATDSSDQEILPPEQIGPYDCVGETGRFTISPEDALIVQTVYDSLPLPGGEGQLLGALITITGDIP
ncbi:MAG: tetratricopeptide repeat protein [Cyanobacteria bacterium SBLK]|nr:tetratricopeptide repeat protein [Cyanobacteria bacterium SBLK]